MSPLFAPAVFLLESQVENPVLLSDEVGHLLVSGSNSVSFPRDCRKSASRMAEEVEKHVSMVFANSTDLPKPTRLRAHPVQVYGTPSHPSQPWEWWDHINAFVARLQNRLPEHTHVRLLEAS
jgi:hypothetical protein